MASVEIKLPDHPMRNVNIECNAPLSSINARVEKVNYVHGVHVGLMGSLAADDASDPVVGGHGEQPAVVFHSLPRAHDSAVEVQRRTRERQQEKEAKLDAFLETTRARVGLVCVVKAKTAGEDFGAVPVVVDEKTRRRLDQSLSLLLPRSTTSMSRSKRVRAWEGQASRGEGGSMGAAGEEETLMSASDIATVLGDAVMCNISDGQRARESLLSHCRKHVSEDSLPSPSRSSEVTGSAHATAATDNVDVSLSHSLARESKGTLKEGSSFSVACSVSAAAWEGSSLRDLREKENQLAIYKQVRRSLMMGERNRVRQLREKRKEEEERERAEDTMRKERELVRQRRAAEDELLERERQLVQQAAMAVNLEAERERQAKVSAPQRAQLEKKRYMEALRCQILEGATAVAASYKGAAADKVVGTKAMAVCPCVPPRSMTDSRVWLCASNCALKDNPKAYHKLIMHLCSGPVQT